MSGCKYTPRMSAFRDSEMAEEERRQLQKHIRHCTECARELERLRAISRFLAAAEVPQLAPAALQRFHRVVNGASEKVVFRMALTSAAAAAAVLLVGLVWLLQADGAQDARAGAAPEWEKVAVMQQAELSGAVSSEAQLAQWIVEDLSRENAGD